MSTALALDEGWIEPEDFSVAPPRLAPLDLAMLARGIAMDIDEPRDLLDRFGLTDEQYGALTMTLEWSEALRQARIALTTKEGVRERTQLKMEVVTEIAVDRLARDIANPGNAGYTEHVKTLTALRASARTIRAEEALARINGGMTGVVNNITIVMGELRTQLRVTTPVIVESAVASEELIASESTKETEG